MYCVLMAGGAGTRFWPRSRSERSKQFLKIFGNLSLIESTLVRFQSITPLENTYIVTNIKQKKELEKHELKIPEGNIIYEPVGRNTAPCIGLAALFIQKRDPDGVMIVSPADHLIKNKSKFKRVILAAVSLAKKEDGLVTIGIKPDRPATGYGYIQINRMFKNINGIDTFTVKTFAEKPDIETAKRFIESGDFYWNSGIFVFKVGVILKALKSLSPDIYKGLSEIQKHIGRKSFHTVLNRVYQDMRKISIDYAVMEKASNVYLVKGDFRWNDLGSWEQVYRLSKKDEMGNVVSGDVVMLDTKDSYIYSSDGLVAVLGLDNVIVVHDNDITLICNRESAEDVKKIVEKLERKKFKKYL